MFEVIKKYLKEAENSVDKLIEEVNRLNSKGLTREKLKSELANLVDSHFSWYRCDPEDMYEFSGHFTINDKDYEFCVNFDDAVYAELRNEDGDILTESCKGIKGKKKLNESTKFYNTEEPDVYLELENLRVVGNPVGKVLDVDTFGLVQNGDTVYVVTSTDNPDTVAAYSVDFQFPYLFKVKNENSNSERYIEGKDYNTHASSWIFEYYPSFDEAKSDAERMKDEYELEAIVPAGKEYALWVHSVGDNKRINESEEKPEEKIDEHLIELLKTKDKVARDSSMSDEIAYKIMEDIDNEMINCYPIEEIEAAEKMLGLNESESLKESGLDMKEIKDIVYNAFDGTDFSISGVELLDGGIITFDVCAFGPDGEMDRTVELEVPELNYLDAVREACENWMSEHDSPDSFYD